MEIQEFIGAIEEEFVDVAPGTLAPDTRFRELDGWSSMLALILIARIDSDHDVTISAEELASVHTVQQLFDMVQAKS